MKPMPSAVGSDDAPKTSSGNVRFGRPVDPEMSVAFEKLAAGLRFLMMNATRWMNCRTKWVLWQTTLNQYILVNN